MAVKPGFPKAALQGKQEDLIASSVASEETDEQNVVAADVTEEDKPMETEHDVSLIKAGLASFL